MDPPIRKGHAVFVENGEGFYGARVVYVGLKHYRVHTYYVTGLPYRHNVLKEHVRLQDGQH